MVILPVHLMGISMHTPHGYYLEPTLTTLITWITLDPYAYSTRFSPIIPTVPCSVLSYFIKTCRSSLTVWAMLTGRLVPLTILYRVHQIVPSPPVFCPLGAWPGYHIVHQISLAHTYRMNKRQLPITPVFSNIDFDYASQFLMSTA